MSVLVLPELSQQTLLYGSLLVVVVFMLVVAHIARKRSKARGSLVLLVGAADAGKTSILSTMIYGQTLPTHTSLFVNSSIVTSPSSKKPLCIVDVPGHQRLRDAFKDYIPDAKAIVFVVDSGSITRNGKVVAEYMHNVLHAITSLPPTHALPPVLILAHKADLIKAPASSTSSTPNGTPSSERTSLAISRVRTILERELEARRAAQASGVVVEGLGEEGERTELGGLDCTGAGGVFKFADWEGSEVSFVGTWVASGRKLIGTNEKENEKSDSEAEEGLDGLRDWLDTLS
ncbi:hypothetical protein SCHPADRAFT_827917 [Schizopora paradoxa]|uniref:Signal recognition particle receptor subunit beta n=1 Tax=Schizopora paradoxa TaxID=27342 RepID=A0A0H2RPJ7_9AGAM|nr:hypothetical protein SCHPADRAFT_827917 [Schizopora paradoxa]